MILQVNKLQQAETRGCWVKLHNWRTTARTLIFHMKDMKQDRKQKAEQAKKKNKNKTGASTEQCVLIHTEDALVCVCVWGGVIG